MRFQSTILEPDGQSSSLVLEASDVQTLHEEMARSGRILVRARALAEQADANDAGSVALPSRRLLLLTQALQEALDAGVPLLSTFQAVGQQEVDPAIAGMLEDLADRVASGQSLSDALQVYPRAFPTVYVALVRAGEQSGSLPEVLQSITGFLEWQLEIRGIVKQALIYPLVVGLAGYGMVLFLLSFVIPRLATVLNKIGGELPAASKILLACSGLVAEHILAIGVGSVATLVAVVWLLRTPQAQSVATGLLAQIPVAREVVRTLAIAQFCRTFSVLLRAGLTMTTALELGAAAVSLPKFRGQIEAASERILGGARLGEAIESVGVLPPVALSMVKVGEEAGRLPVTFERLSRLYDREVKESVKRALGLLEPIVTVGLGVIVGGVAVVVITTIYSAMRGIGK